MSPLVLPLDAPDPELSVLGGKGASLARLAAAGFPVPDGFHVTTAAYLDFVHTTAIQQQLLDVVARAGADDRRLEAASRQIRKLFDGHPVPLALAAQIVDAYERLAPGGGAVAVRSSATAEDLPDLSFAGQHDTFLNVVGSEQVVDAVRCCWSSLWSARAIEYRSRNDVSHDKLSIAVVVQLLVPADAAGVVFTADPVTGARDRIVINAGWGLGEAVVGGLVTPDLVVVDRVTKVISERVVATKKTMTERTQTGTSEVDVPADRQGAPAISDRDAVALAELAVRIEALYETPMDIEWAIADDVVQILQARPITGLGPVRHGDQWNHSLIGEYLWTGSNLGEAVPDVMTPCGWSLIEKFMIDAMGTTEVAGHRLYGSIGGRFYMNLSATISLAAAFGQTRRAIETIEPAFGRLPPGLDVPLVKMNRWAVVRDAVPAALAQQRRVRVNVRGLAHFVANSPARCAKLRATIERTRDVAALGDLWRVEVAPLFKEACRMLEAATRQQRGALARVPVYVKKRLGEADANVLLASADGQGVLASLETLVGLEEIRSGAISPADFGARYGHRGPSELEVSAPRPAEDPTWLDRQLQRTETASVAHRLAGRVEERDAVWRRVEAKDPRRARALRNKIQRWSQITRDREAARSEVVRVFWVLRAFALRAGELTGLDVDVFMLSIDEVLDVLGGAAPPREEIERRRSLYEHYRSLPRYPALIVGAFDPDRWATDPARRMDIFDARGAAAPSDGAIAGFSGAVGVVEARARVVATSEEGEALEPGEVLVTTITNIGWTPLFSRAAAVVTDVGAPLSHAAIVARELGIPAVVGTGCATMRIRTGDLLRVDGAAGTVEILVPVCDQRDGLHP